MPGTESVYGLGACAAEEIYCESGIIGPYFPDFSLNRTTIRLKIEKIWSRFSTFSLRSLLPRRLLVFQGGDRDTAATLVGGSGLETGHLGVGFQELRDGPPQDSHAGSVDDTGGRNAGQESVVEELVQT